MRSIVLTILLCVCAALPLAAQTAAPEGMVQIPAGKFWMGRVNANRGEASNNMPRGWRDDRPANHIYVDAFYIDKYEVTNALYKSCVDSGSCAPHRLLLPARVIIIMAMLRLTIFQQFM